MSTITYNDGFSEKWIQYLSPPEWRGKVRIEFVEVPLSLVEHAGCCTDPEVVAGWMRTLQDAKPIPPVVAVLTERGTYYVHDGNHRLEALNEFLSDGGGDSLVRVAVAVPAPGHEFVYRWCGEYGTYRMQECPRRFASIARACIAILVSVIALSLTALLPADDQTPVFGLFVLSVMIAAWAGDWKAGLLATMTNLTGAAYFLLPPSRSLLVTHRGHIVHLLVTAVVMIAVAIFMQIVRQHPSVKLGWSTTTAKPLAKSARSGA